MSDKKKHDANSAADEMPDGEKQAPEQQAKTENECEAPPQTEQDAQAGDVEQTASEQAAQSKKGKKDDKKQKTIEQQLEEKLEQLNEKFMRVCAEYDNFRKRSVKEKQSVYPQATAAAVGEFVPILDNFERALSAPCADEEFKKGVSMICQSFKDVLKKLDVEEFGAAGDVFNPDMHNAVMHIDDDSLEANVIVEVFQKGYKLGDRIIRHAMVKVAN